MPTTSPDVADHILREVDNIKTAVESLNAKFDSVQKTLLGDVQGRLGKFEQWQTLRETQWTDHVATQTKAEAERVHREREREERLRQDLEKISGACQALDKTFTEKLNQANTTRASEREAKENAARELREKDQAAIVLRDKAIDEKLSYHSFVIKVVVGFAALIAAGLITASFAYIKSNAVAVERLERLESTAPNRASIPEK